MKKIAVACLAVCMAAAMLPSLAACGGQTITLEEGCVETISDGGVAIAAGDYRMDFISPATDTRSGLWIWGFPTARIMFLQMRWSRMRRRLSISD